MHALGGLLPMHGTTFLPKAPISWGCSWRKKNPKYPKIDLPDDLYLSSMERCFFCQARFPTKPCTTGLSRWVGRRTETKQHTHHPPKNPKSSKFPSQRSGQLCEPGLSFQKLSQSTQKQEGQAQCDNLNVPSASEVDLMSSLMTTTSKKHP